VTAVDGVSANGTGQSLTNKPPDGRANRAVLPKRNKSGVPAASNVSILMIAAAAPCDQRDIARNG
jgi:hypothetical protein